MHRAKLTRRTLPLATRHVGDTLDSLLATANHGAHVANDPISFVHVASVEDREVVALIASSLAFGGVTVIRRSIADVLARLDGRPALVSGSSSLVRLEARLDGFVHRVYRGVDVAHLLHHAARLRAAHGSLGAFFALELDSTGDFREACARLCDALRGPSPSRGLSHLVPDPRKGSACKRLLLFLRWMVRGPDAVDFGLWAVSPRRLVIPVDTHVLRISQNLGFTSRTDASWKTAEEITASLARFSPEDPVRYDFALCHLGISRDCPSRQDEKKCARCVVRAVCRVWHGDAVTA
jgi:uncharacterized protein (TIGR02757 family)